MINKFESKNWKIAQAKRLIDFEERKCDEIKNYFRTKSFESEFITVHPMADESWWFDKFNESQKICKKVDLYWKLDGDVVFVEIATKDISGIELFGRWRQGRLYLSANVEDVLVNSGTVQYILKLFWKSHLEENLYQKYYLKRKLCKIN